jgi:hypothetical protein
VSGATPVIFRPLGPFDVAANSRTADLQKMGEGRPVGLHLSELIRDMREAAGLVTKGPEGEQEFVRMQAGFLWETVVDLVLAGTPMYEAWELATKRYMASVMPESVRQVQLERDGIHMTPDGVDFATGAILSFKATWKSEKKADTQESFEQEFWTWLVAEKGYALAAGVDTVRFYIFWVNGRYTYKPGEGPCWKMYECVFTEPELQDNWTAVLKYKAAREEGEARGDR